MFNDDIPWLGQHNYVSLVIFNKRCLPRASSGLSMPWSFPFDLKFASMARNRVYKNLEEN